MKLLIVSTALDVSGSATGVLIGNLIETFHLKGCKADCVTVKGSLYDEDVTYYKGATVYHSNYVTYFRVPRGKRLFKDRLLCILRRITKHNQTNPKRMGDGWQVKALMSKMKEIGAEKYDAVIAVCASHDAIEAVLKYKSKYNCNFKAILIQFDPLAENFSRQNKDKNKLISYEKWIYNECDFVFSAPFILKRKSPDWITPKVIPSELPAIINKNNEREKTDEYINCVYSGDFYKGIREPDFMLDIFSKFKSDKFRLYILSNGQREKFQEYENGKLKGRLFVVGRVSEAECNEFVEKADVLINIGNNIDNQLPSKLLNYMCYGKFILNLYKIDDCPTLPYIKRYPLSISVKESQVISDDLLNEIEKELIENHKSRVDFDFVSNEFRTCTPEYVCDDILSAINGSKI